MVDRHQRTEAAPASLEGASCLSVVGARATFALYPPVEGPLILPTHGPVLLLPFGAGLVELRDDKGAKHIRTRAGAMFTFPAGTAPCICQLEPVEWLAVLLHPEEIFEREPNDDPGPATLFGEMRRAMLAGGVDVGRYLDALLDAVLIRLGRTREEPLPDRRGRGESLPGGKLRRVLAHIESHLAEPISVETLADLAKTTRSHFSRAFAAETGDPPQRYLVKQRVCRARDLLSASDLGVAEIAVRTGFSSHAHLTTAFRRLVGTTPARYRAAFRRGEAVGENHHASPSDAAPQGAQLIA